MALNIVVLAAAGLLLSLSLRLHNFAAVLMMIGQILDIPFKPLVPQQYLLVLAFNQFGLIFFLPMVLSDNLIQVTVYYTILFINLCARLHINLYRQPYWFMVIFFYLMNCGIALQMVTSILGNCKTIFQERHESQLERDNFKNILDNFNQGIIIVGTQQLPELQKAQDSKKDNYKKEVIQHEVMFLNKEIIRVLGDIPDQVMDKKQFLSTNPAHVK